MLNSWCLLHSIWVSRKGVFLSETEAPVEGLNRLNALCDEGRHADAEAQARALLGEFPRSGQAWHVLGLALNAQGKPAIDALKRAAELLPDRPDVFCNLGIVLEIEGRTKDAEANYHKAVVLNPWFPTAHCNLGVIQEREGLNKEAEANFRKAVALDPWFSTAHYNLGLALRKQGLFEEALESFRAALAIDPTHHDASHGMEYVLSREGRLLDAEEHCRRILRFKPDFAEMRQLLSKNLAYKSDYTEVLQESDRAFEAQTVLPWMWAQRLYSLSYHPDLSAEAIYKEFVRWGDRFPEPHVNFLSHDRNPNRRLRIGYVSPDFRKHTSRFYFWPLFQNHDRESFELFAYSNVEHEVAWTRLFKGQFEHWRDIQSLDDEAAAELVRADGIDILVDLCGHMDGDRLGLFALKPAPIQATWLGSAWTTGLKAMDYVLFDPYVAPEGTLTRESIIRLPHSFMVFRPKEDAPELQAPPCQKNGFVTFGYSGRTERLNHRTFRVWGEILKRLPDAKLILDFPPFADARTQDYYRTFLAQHGVDKDRVIMRKSPNIFEGLNDIDILLDSFPHSGGTMIMDALWMGVPALTLASRPPVGRLGTGMMMNLGLPEWVAQSEGEYIDKACQFAGDSQRLKELRTGMRERMQNSPLMDGPGFARNFEAAYRAMFEHWISA